MHLDAALGFVVAHDVPKPAEIEIRVEFAVDSRENVLVESGRDAGGIVVGQFNYRNGLLEIGGQQERVALPKNRAEPRRKNWSPAGRSKFPMVLPRKSTSRRSPSRRRAATSCSPSR